jgi:hypothetical protein
MIDQEIPVRQKPFGTVPNGFLTKKKFFWEPESVFYLISLFGPRRVSWIRSTSFLVGGTNASKTVRYGTGRFFTVM